MFLEGGIMDGEGGQKKQRHVGVGEFMRKQPTTLSIFFICCNQLSTTNTSLPSLN